MMKMKLVVFCSVLVFCLFSKTIEAREIFRDSFDSEISKDWIIREGGEGSTFGIDKDLKMKGGGSLRVDFGSGKFALMEKKFLELPTNVLVRTFVYDEYDIAKDVGIILAVRESDVQEGIGIGVMSTYSKDYYVMRVDGSTNTKVTKIKRSKGWHMWEIIVTPSGSYAKIDGTLVNIDPENGNSISEFWKNTEVTRLGIAQLGQSWSMFGKSNWDEFVVVSADEGQWQEQFWRRFDSYYDIYQKTDVSNIYLPLRGESWAAGNARSRGGMALYFYLYGLKHQDAVARERGVTMMSRLVSDFEDIGSWTRGASLLPMVRGVYLMKNDLSLATMNRFKELMNSQALKIIETDPGKPNPQSGYEGDTKSEENAWDAAFLASMANFFPEMANSKKWEEEANCFAFHVFTRGREGEDNFCGKTTQTVYENFNLENHGKISPMYANGSILFLNQAGQSYELTGKKIPNNFFHNVVPMFQNFIKPKIDQETYYWMGVPSDWVGVWNSFEIYGLSVLDFLDKAELNHGINRNDFLSKMSLFAYKIPGNYIKGEIQEDKIESNDYSQIAIRDWRLNTIIAGEYYSTVAMELGLVGDTSGETPTPTQVSVLGDANRDGKVDLVDFSIWKSEYLGGMKIKCDFNKDGSVNLVDFGIWKREYLN